MPRTKKQLDQSPKFYEGAEFKKLQKKWYKKLEKSGFEEAEDVDSVEEFMLRWHDKDIKAKGTWDQLVARAAYYQTAEAHALDGHFDTALDKRIWTLHAQGLTVREIAQKVKTITKTPVHTVVLKIRKQLYGF